MKKNVFAASALIGLAFLSPAARAADIEPTPAAYDWSGFYLGLNAGVAWNNTEIDHGINYDGPNSDIISGLDELSSSLTGDDAVFTGGALIGYNWQHDALVFGIEADINYLGFGGEQDSIHENIDGFGLDATSHLSLESDWFGTLRGRLGFAADNLLFYGTGGLAYGHMEAESDFRVYDGATEIGHLNGSADDVNWGWTIGAGMEYGIDNWSLGVEYLYVDLGDADWDADYEGSNTSIDFADATSEGSVDYQFSVVRATAKLRF